MISIRPVNPNEANALTLIAISAKRHWDYPERWIEIWTPQLTFSPEYFQVNESWVAEVNPSPVGFYTIQERDGTAWLENFWVLPAYMGKGVGRQLFQHAVRVARRRGFKTLQLEADPNAVGFYKKMGMRKVGERLFEIEGQPRILPVMEIKI